MLVRRLALVEHEGHDVHTLRQRERAVDDKSEQIVHLLGIGLRVIATRIGWRKVSEGVAWHTTSGRWIQAWSFVIFSFGGRVCLTFSSIMVTFTDVSCAELHHG